MDVFTHSGTDDTPKVHLDAASNIFEISGRSLPEDVVVFYKPVLDWLDKYMESPNQKTVFSFKLNYFNTASSKIILDILLKLEKMFEEGNDVLVKWNYPKSDEDMKEAGEEYAEIVELPFEHIGY